MSKSRVVFESRSPRLASLTVEAGAGGFGLTLDRRLQEHRLGFRDAPAFRLAQPFSPDDAWVVEPIESGRLLLLADENETAASDTIEAFGRWAAGSRVTHGETLVGLLPQGRYLVIRSPRLPSAAERVLMGNEYVPAAPCMRVLSDQPPVYACVVGARRTEPPDLSQPLLGLAVLNYVGESWMHGMLFFPCARPAATEVGDDRDLVLIVPVEGELVHDNLGFFSADGEQRSLSRWRDEQSSEFARWCAGETPG